MPEHSSMVFRGMNERRKKGELCDFEIRVERKKFPVHRLVLDTCSEYFRTMFTSGMQESVQGFCEFNEVEAEVVKTCVEFMYTGEMDIAADTAVSVLQLAHMWQLHRAVKICEGILCVNLNTECCFPYRRLASLYGLKNLLSRCTNLIFSEIEIFKDSSEIEDLNLSEIKSLLKKWEQHCYEQFPTYLWNSFQQGTVYRHHFGETKESNIAFWKLCRRWSEFKNINFCQIVECFQIKILLVDDFVNTVMEDKHVKECGKCKQSVCQRYLDDDGAFQTISDENCLILKDLANRYNCKTFKKRLANYIRQKYKTISKRPEFDALVPPEDFIAYMKCCKNWECSEKLSIIASWIRFSPDREKIFPKVFKDEQLKSTDLESFCEIRNVLLIKTLSQKYSCKKVHKAALQFIITNFMSVIKLPDF